LTYILLAIGEHGLDDLIEQIDFVLVERRAKIK